MNPQLLPQRHLLPLPLRALVQQFLNQICAVKTKGSKASRETSSGISYKTLSAKILGTKILSTTTKASRETRIEAGHEATARYL